MVNALCMLSVVPVMVTIRSGHEPSDMLILAPLCKNTYTILYEYYYTVLNIEVISNLNN